jgi:hypothetical protein
MLYMCTRARSQSIKIESTGNENPQILCTVGTGVGKNERIKTKNLLPYPK